MYYSIFKEVIKLRYVKNIFLTYRLFHVGKYFSAFITPFLILSKISANSISYSRYIIGWASVISVAFTTIDELLIPVLLFILCWLFDFVDGDIARIKKESTFYGRYIDGTIDIHIDSFLFLSFGIMLYNSGVNINWLIFGAISCILTVMANLNIDRYSAFRRWIKEENNIDIGTHELPYLIKLLSTIYLDAYIIIMILTAISSDIFYAKIFIMIGIAWNTLFYMYYLILGMRNTRGIEDKPKHDGSGNLR